MREKRMSLRTKLTIAFLLVATVPVVMLATWVERSAVQKEFDTVTEKHLIIARNLSAAMERYANDIAAAVSAAASSKGDARDWRELLGNLDIHSAIVVDGEKQEVAWSGARFPVTVPLPDTALAELSAPNVRSIGPVRFSNLTRIADRPVMLVAAARTGGGDLVVVLDTPYLVKLQKSIAFGELGHSMMVDASGRVIAHPNAEWQRISKNASKLSVVQKMMRGETGVAEFYSPPMKADMIAGHTSVAGVGWGVMVPQPVRELYVHATEVTMMAIIITVLGLTGAGVLGWWLARRIAAPFAKIRDQMLDVESPEQSYVREALPNGATHEAHQLAESFEEMVARLRLSSAEIVAAKEAAGGARFTVEVPNSGLGTPVVAEAA